MRIKKLLFLATYFPDPQNPSRGNWALEQAKAFQDAGLEVLVIVPTPWIPKFLGRLHPKLAAYSETPNRIETDGIRIEYPRWACYPWHAFHGINRRFPDKIIDAGWLSVRGRINRLVCDFQPDAIVAHHTLVAGQLAHKLWETHHIPFVVTDHEVGDLINCQSNRKVRQIFGTVGRAAIRMVVVSNAMKREAQKVLPGIDFSTIYNGSSFEVYERPFADKKEDPVTVFCCAKFYGRKDIPLLLKAFDAVVDRGYNAHLRIAGDGPDRSKIETCIGTLKHKERICLLGLIPSNEVVKEMRTADIFALVGWAEPFGVVFLEAMATGLPLVVSEDAGVAEILTDGETALFTQPQDRASVEEALAGLVGSPELRKRIGRAGQSLFSKKFRWSNIITEYIELFTPVEENR